MKSDKLPQVMKVGAEDYKYENKIKKTGGVEIDRVNQMPPPHLR